jgi:GalNAc-alpha-(1->4)-GalNAc-alpha-(1->3)-diNAcBac-PP-undecaprenol alpha-1,4-N-acetyl-D-galactosaminyltransferase
MILFVISSLQVGGAERVVAHLANFWAEKGREVSILTLEKTAQSHYPLHPKVKIVPLDLLKASPTKLLALKNNLRRLWILRGAIRARRPSVVISFMEENNVLTCFSTLFNRQHRLLISDRTHPELYGDRPIWQFLKRLSYRFADALVVQTQAVKLAYKGFNLPIHVVPNPLPTSPQIAIDYSRKTIVSVGRLDENKNFDLQIRAFARLNAPDWTLQIFGHGEHHAVLAALIIEKGLENRVILRGVSKNIFEDALSQASIFTFSSRSEGYPNALLEAMSAGLAVISTDCPFGPAEIIEPNINGLLVPNDDEAIFTITLQRLIDNVHFRERLGTNAAKIAETLSIDSIAAKWENLGFA